MCDQSPYTIEERLVSSVWMHERVLNHQKIPEIRRTFEWRFGRTAPTPRVLRKWEKKAFECGSVLDATRCGRPTTSAEHLPVVEESLLRCPTLSVRKRSTELRIPRSTLRKVLRIKFTPSKKCKNTDPPLCDQMLDPSQIKEEIS